MHRRGYILIPLLLVSALCFSQSGDTLHIQDVPDSVEHFSLDTAQFEWSDYEEVYYHAEPDSLAIDARSFDEASLEELKNDPAFDYKQPPTIVQSLWERFKLWLSQFIQSIFENAVQTNWGRVIVYIIGIAVLIVVIMLMLKVNAFKVIYSGTGASKKYNVFDENIHEMDFEKLLAEAIDKGDFKRGIRLLFLHALKLLSDRHLIEWESGKTNHDYVEELKEPSLRSGLNELSVYFEYAWYGNFTIDKATFEKAQQSFTHWRGGIG